jgi:hypothetical protein
MFPWYSKPTPPADELAKPAPKQTEFARFVGAGYVDSAGVWYESEADAERASAKSVMSDRLYRVGTYYAYAGRGMLGDKDRYSEREFLADREVVRAMAILGRDA